MGPRPIPDVNLAKERPEAFRSPNMGRFPMSGDLPSPRTGEAPPALSPLDAFAMQSRALARKFEEEAQNGRRISRLPPLMVAESMSNRPEYFRGPAGTGGDMERRMSDVDEEDHSPVSQRGQKVEAPSADKNRPVSLYPTLGIADKTDAANSVPSTLVEELDGSSLADAGGYFGAASARVTSPEPIRSQVIHVEAPSPLYAGAAGATTPRSMTNGSQHSARSLGPPQSPRHPPRSPRSFQSIRSVPPDSGDEDLQSASGSHPTSEARKFSGSSGMSRPHSPFSPWMRPIHRSPSMTSEYSISGSQQFPRPSPNFSRPMSSAGSRPSVDARPSTDTTLSSDGRPSFEIRPSRDLHERGASTASSSTQTSTHSLTPSRQTSTDDYPRVPSSLHISHTAHAPGLDDISRDPLAPEPSSYIYAKYALPRGRPMERDSAASRDSWLQKQFPWEDHPSVTPFREAHDRTYSTDAVLESIPRPPPSPAVSEHVRSGRDSGVSTSTIRSRSANPPRTTTTTTTPTTPTPTPTTAEAPRPPVVHRASPSVTTDTTSSTDKTIRPLHEKASSSDLTADEHLEIGIAAHSSGETNKSTYHLRLAALAGVPTAMLLYGLACRHGWGMRANQAEGVHWLRQAMTTSGLDVLDAEDKLTRASSAGSNGNPLGPVEKRKRKAQYALAIYELGISAMNGWGCARDKPLALRCFEVAGSWGDVDALAEAGFCYTQGVGCKKDLKKAATLYRQAADMGMSMAGNSWIYKAKYMDDPAAADPKPADKDRSTPRPDTAASKDSANARETDNKKDSDAPSKEPPTGRARSRSFWGRKKDKPPALVLSEALSN